MAPIAFGKGFTGAFGKGIADSPFHPDKQFQDGISVEEAAELGGLNFEFATGPSLYMVNGALKASGEQTIYRKDTGDYISTMSQQYKLVQPMEILETHSKLLDTAGYHIRSCGTFKNGARFWSMAEAHGELVLPGDDRVKSYLFMASSADGSSATYAIGTAQRLWCWNMAPAIVADAKKTDKFIKVNHSSTFDADEARTQIQANDDIFKLWSQDARVLAETKISVSEALNFFADVFEVKCEDDPISKLEAAQENKRSQKCLELFCGAGQGSQAESSNGTLWGAFNAVTEYVDHHANTATAESRFASASIGNGSRIKRAAWQLSLDKISV